QDESRAGAALRQLLDLFELVVRGAEVEGEAAVTRLPHSIDERFAQAVARWIALDVLPDPAHLLHPLVPVEQAAKGVRRRRVGSRDDAADPTVGRRYLAEEGGLVARGVTRGIALHQDEAVQRNSFSRTVQVFER